MKSKWLSIALVLSLLLGVAPFAMASSAFVPIDPDAFGTMEVDQAASPDAAVPSLDAFVPGDTSGGNDMAGEASTPEGVQAKATPAPTQRPVQDQGIITLESRRVFGGDLVYTIDEIDYKVNWSAGVAYVEDATRMGPLRHVWVFTEEEGIEVASFDYAYDRAQDGEVAFLTLSVVLALGEDEYTFREIFRVTPNGQGAKVQPWYQ